MEREIWFGFAVPGLILLTLRAAQADAVVHVDPGFRRKPLGGRASWRAVRFTCPDGCGSAGASPSHNAGIANAPPILSQTRTLVGIEHEGHLGVERS